ncbi:hybrid sensor histidine kinase/response regulator [Flavobacterium faecale]|uniref:histidine kinase n=1 Tax=Flavobacterium faecale TaxID=1355330 RepID=A0A2S1LH35_9FLAO|nr:response regulator [Flavobacterium faecale]AWG23064.1 hybrid sensor histidine kinase/response regulator [Flavobacterium faecale]
MYKSKILLIDDEITLRETIHEILANENYEVVSLSSAQEALDLLDNWVPDLIICDIMMPVMDGFMFYEILKEVKPLSAVPFIFLTAKKEDNLMRKCLLLGADDFLIKPFIINELVKIVEVKINRFKKIKNTVGNLFVGEKKYLLHEVNTSLNGILGSINLLIDGGDDLEKDNIKEFHDIIKICGYHLNRTMFNLFLYQNVINNEVRYSEKDKSNIGDTFENVLNTIQIAYNDADERIFFRIKKATIKVSEEYLYFILYEIVENALKFSDSKSVSVIGKPFDDKYYRVVIKDSGIGFSQEELKKIDAGQQFNREKREQQGLGLGIFLTRAILKKLGGVFTIISTVNMGTEITLYFPI